MQVCRLCFSKHINHNTCILVRLFFSFLLFLRFNLFRLGKHSEELLPPTKDSLQKHVLRANYQTALWRRCLKQVQDLPGPVGNGWQMSDDGGLEVHWSDLPCAPESVLKTVHCSCKTSGCGSATGIM